MASFRVNSKQLTTLQRQSDLAYELLNRAHETDRIEPDKSTLIQASRILHKDLLGHSLREITFKATTDFTKLNKGGKRARPIEPYILQYALMCGAISTP